jgi:hypothetical protein
VIVLNPGEALHDDRYWQAGHSHQAPLFMLAGRSADQTARHFLASLAFGTLGAFGDAFFTSSLGGAVPSFSLRMGAA